MSDDLADALTLVVVVCSMFVVGILISMTLSSTPVPHCSRLLDGGVMNWERLK